MFIQCKETFNDIHSSQKLNMFILYFFLTVVNCRKNLQTKLMYGPNKETDPILKFSLLLMLSSHYFYIKISSKFVEC